MKKQKDSISFLEETHCHQAGPLYNLFCSNNEYLSVLENMCVLTASFWFINRLLCLLLFFSYYAGHPQLGQISFVATLSEKAVHCPPTCFCQKGFIVDVTSDSTLQHCVSPQCTMGFPITFKEMEQFFLLQINIVTSIFIKNC